MQQILYSASTCDALLQVVREGNKFVIKQLLPKLLTLCANGLIFYHATTPFLMFDRGNPIKLPLWSAKAPKFQGI
jgi:hypothetical protein